MSAKILTSLSDENQNLQKQMGCMNGIFQLFDRHHFLTGRRLSNHNNKKLPPGPNHNVELACGKEKDKQRNQEIGYEKHRTSTESSQSSSSSSFSSADQNTSSKPSRTSSRRHSFAESLPQNIPAKHQENPTGRQSPDLRDVVKDAMHREARSLSIKMVTKEEGKKHVMKHIDSPRPLHSPKSWKPSVAGGDGSTQSQAKYREAPRIAKEEMDTSVRQRPKDLPRFSYDGTKSSIKLKELPRLSLDSRDTRIMLRDSGGERGAYDQANEPSSNKRSTVIAKLMGLEPFPDHPFADQSITTTSDGDPLTRSSLSADLNRANNIPLSPRLQKDHMSQGSSKSNFLKKTPANSRLPLEQAPWRQQNANLEPHNLAVRNKEAPAKSSLASSTIYGQIEKRITDLEFKGSGKDLRALKQILEAMQKTRIRLDNQQEEVDLESQTSRCSLEYSSGNHPLRSSSPAVTTNKSTSPRKHVDKSSRISPVSFSHIQKIHVENGKSKGVDSIHKRIGRDQRQVRGNPQQSGRSSPNEEKKIKGRILNTPQLSKEIKTNEENSIVLTKSSGAMSPRTRRKEVLERKNRNSPSSDLPMARSLSSSPSRNPNVKSSYLQADDIKYKLDKEMRARFHHDDAASLQSESNNSSVSLMESDFTSTYSYENGCKQQGGYKSRDLALRLKNNTPSAELVIPTAEQPSPVSVLDASFYREDSPSPVKRIPTPFNDVDFLESDEAAWSPKILDHLQEAEMPNVSVGANIKRAEEIRSLVHKLDELNRGPHEATTDHIEALPGNTNPNHRYITKIFLQSGLLRDISFLSNPIQLHSNGHVINPKLFHFLEQTEGQNEFSGITSQMKVNQKIQRKIVFDTVNEILARKLCSERYIPLSLTSVSGIELLKEIHVDVERLQKLSYSSNDDDEKHDHDQVLSIWEADMDHQSEGWKGYQGEMPALVLDIERLIFKDLVTEAINDEITGQQNRPKHSKKLFSN